MIPAEENPESSERDAQVKHKEERLFSLLLPWKSRILIIERILIWDNPGLTGLIIMAVNILFLSMYRFAGDWSFLTLSTVASAVFMAAEALVCFIWPNRNEKADEDDTEGYAETQAELKSVATCSAKFAEMWQKFEERTGEIMKLRQCNRAKFFVTSVFILSSVGVLGVFVPGLFLTYIFLSWILMYEGLRHHSGFLFIRDFLQLLTTRTERALNIRRHRHSNRGGVAGDSDEFSEDEDLNDFIPETGLSPLIDAGVSRGAGNTAEGEEDEMEEETGFTPVMGRSPCRRRRPPITPQHFIDDRSRDNSDDDLLSDDLPHFAQGLGTEMPSIDDHMDSLTTFTPRQPEMPSFDHPDNYSLSDGSHDNLSFVSSHFRQSSGGDEDEEEEPLAEGLSFEESSHDNVDDDDGTDVVGMLGGVISQGKAALVSAVASSAPTMVTALVVATASRLSDMATAAAPSGVTPTEQKGEDGDITPTEQKGEGGDTDAGNEEILGDVIDKEFVFVELDELDEAKKDN